MDEKDAWSWKKFFKGFFDGKNYAKSIVLGFCMLVVLLIVTSVFTTIRAKFQKPTQAIGTNNGTIETNNKEEHSWSLLNLFKIG
jgi:hypothetical protein